MNLLLIVVLSISISQISSVTFAPTVTTRNGKIRGVVKETDDGSKVNLYYGIPYGKPPIGKLRFSKPEPVSNWEGVYDATKVRFACMQDNSDGLTEGTIPVSEDCLYLSVWQPSTNTTKRSVMFFVHGGTFKLGSMFSLAYDARYLAALGDVIVVTINYRLGPFGFLYGNTSDTPGNVGLHDQLQALKWVNQNVEAFGGDPSSITIFGHSAGSMSIGGLVLSPLTAGLFKRAILQSGSPNSFLGSEPKENALSTTKSMAKSLHCNQSSIPDIINCIREKPAKDLLSFSKHSTINGQTFQPIFGDELMPIKPSLALEAGNFNHNIDILFGTVRDEGAVFMDGISNLVPSLNNITVSKTKMAIQLLFMLMKQSYASEVANFYTLGLKDTDEDKLHKAITNSFGDYHLTCPTVLFGSAIASKNSNTSRSYAYRVSLKPSLSIVHCNGVCHGDDIVFVFGFPVKLRGIGFNENDYKLSTDMIRAWTSFAKNGKIAPLDNLEWQEAIDKNMSNPYVRLMELIPNNYHMLDHEYKDSCEGFWKAHL